MIICGLRKNIKKAYRNMYRTRKSKCKSKIRKKVKQMKRKLDKNKVGMFIATVITTTLLIQKIVQAGTIFCLITTYQ